MADFPWVAGESAIIRPNPRNRRGTESAGDQKKQVREDALTAKEEVPTTIRRWEVQAERGSGKRESEAFKRGRATKVREKSICW